MTDKRDNTADEAEQQIGLELDTAWMHSTKSQKQSIDGARKNLKALVARIKELESEIKQLLSDSKDEAGYHDILIEELKCCDDLHNKSMSTKVAKDITRICDSIINKMLSKKDTRDEIFKALAALTDKEDNNGKL